MPQQAAIVVKGTKSILEKCNVRLYSRISTYKVDQKNLGITAIERTIRNRNGDFAASQALILENGPKHK
ncbi:hypothetical protein [Paenibacillus taichungensis]